MEPVGAQVPLAPKANGEAALRTTSNNAIVKGLASVSFFGFMGLLLVLVFWGWALVGRRFRPTFFLD
jgi:hypothetical protein